MLDLSQLLEGVGQILWLLTLAVLSVMLWWSETELVDVQDLRK